jgi:dienelactone hydrolase
MAIGPRFAAAALAFAAGLGFAREPAYEVPGQYKATSHDERWFDAHRNREVLLRLRLPDAPGSRPVVLFSHGLGGSIEGGRYWGEHWASHGFVVIHLQHPGSDERVWKGARRPGVSLRAAASAEQLLIRAKDVKFVLDELQRRADAGDATARLIDLRRIGLSGHSFGAVTTQAIAGQDYGSAARGHELADARPRAFIAFSPSARNRSAAWQFASIDRPFFSVTGTDDGRVGLGLGVVPELRLLPFAAMPPGDKFLLNLDGADHMIFNGGPRLRGERGDPRRDALHVRLIRATTTAFWLAYLADDADARSWLTSAWSYVGDAGEFRSK